MLGMEYTSAGNSRDGATSLKKQATIFKVFTGEFIYEAINFLFNFNNFA